MSLQEIADEATVFLRVLNEDVHVAFGCDVGCALSQIAANSITFNNVLCASMRVALDNDKTGPLAPLMAALAEQKTKQAMQQSMDIHVLAVRAVLDINKVSDGDRYKNLALLARVLAGPDVGDGITQPMLEEAARDPNTLGKLFQAPLGPLSAAPTTH